MRRVEEMLGLPPLRRSRRITPQTSNEEAGREADQSPTGVSSGRSKYRLIVDHNGNVSVTRITSSPC